MQLQGYDDDVLDEEQVIDDVLGENLRARELQLMRHALEHRRGMFHREFERTGDERERHTLHLRLAELDRQIAAIRQEEEITTFVEGSVRVTLRNTTGHNGADEFDEFDD